LGCKHSTGKQMTQRALALVSVGFVQALFDFGN
jgi:hypothetical protein